MLKNVSVHNKYIPKIDIWSTYGDLWNKILVVV